MQFTHTVNDAFVASIDAARKAHNEQAQASVNGQTALVYETVQSFLAAKVSELVRGFVRAHPIVEISLVRSVSIRQGRAALIRTGRMATVNGIIDAMPETTPEEQVAKALARDAIERAPVWERTDPMLNQLAAAAGWTQAEVDQLFDLAETL